MSMSMSPHLSAPPPGLGYDTRAACISIKDDEYDSSEYDSSYAVAHAYYMRIYMMEQAAAAQTAAANASYWAGIHGVRQVSTGSPSPTNSSITSPTNASSNNSSSSSSKSRKQRRWEWWKRAMEAKTSGCCTGMNGEVSSLAPSLSSFYNHQYLQVPTIS